MTSARLDCLLLVGDTVTLQPPVKAPPFIARICRKSAKATGPKVLVCWFYRPEEVAGGRKKFHGERELFSSNHYDWVPVSTLSGKCVVHSLKGYTALQVVGDQDYFARTLYNIHTRKLRPRKIVVYCKCQKPYNPDQAMVKCEICTKWFHPNCLGLETLESVSCAEFVCPSCT
mmetsp:Transcript_1187/g.3917  ORF Transcript_1187/g.3917 Transcript_1187/m.3917 type:complete len:173 (-) Transcript_1187:3695-4213(-)